MYLNPRQSVGIAMSRLRFGVKFCCWMIAAALAIHMTVWGLVFCTDLRFDGPPPPTIIAHAPSQADASPHLLVQPHVETNGPPAPAVFARPISKWDRVFAASVELSGGVGKLALLLMIPLVAMGVLLGAGSGTPGVEKAVSAFAWSLGIGLLALPLGRLLGLTWEEGALVTYPSIVAGARESVVMLAIHLLLPATCIVALALVGVKFSDATIAANLTPEHHFDPKLEREASNVKPASLIGGRGGAALTAALRQDGRPATMPAAAPIAHTHTLPHAPPHAPPHSHAPAAPSATTAATAATTTATTKSSSLEDDGLPRIGQYTKGEAPRRLI